MSTPPIVMGCFQSACMGSHRLTMQAGRGEMQYNAEHDCCDRLHGIRHTTVINRPIHGADSGPHLHAQVPSDLLAASPAEHIHRCLVALGLRTPRISLLVDGLMLTPPEVSMSPT